MELISVQPPQFKHQKVEAEIRLLAAGMPAGARLPAERRLADQFGCNFLTIRRALKRLVDDGVVVRRIGSGTFVAPRASAPDVRRAGGERVGVLAWKGGEGSAHRIMQALAHEAKHQQVELFPAWVGDFSQSGLAQAARMAEEGCVSLIMPWFPRDRIEEARSFVHRCALPVCLPVVIPGLEVNSFERQEIFGSGTLVATEQLCGYFHALGHRRIAWLGPDMPGDALAHRGLSAYACYTSRMQLPNHCGLVQAGAAAMDLLAERWRQYRGDLAVICYDDEHALRFMTAMHKLGLGAPDDFQIIGCNDTEAGAYSDPPLSTVCQNFNHIAHWMVKNALALARGDAAQATAAPRSRMIVRSTCGGAGRITDDLRRAFPAMEFLPESESRRPLAGLD